MSSFNIWSADDPDNNSNTGPIGWASPRQPRESTKDTNQPRSGTARPIRSQELAGFSEEGSIDPAYDSLSILLQAEDVETNPGIVDWKANGQLKTLEKVQAAVLKKFSRHLTELQGYLTKNKAMTVESAYRFFFETYNAL